ARRAGAGLAVMIAGRTLGSETMSQADEEAIRALENQFNAAWDRHDPEGMAESLADDAQFITVNGVSTTTRNRFRDLMARRGAERAGGAVQPRHQIAKAVARR